MELKHRPIYRETHLDLLQYTRFFPPYLNEMEHTRPIQIRNLLKKEACERGKADGFAKDCLVRCFQEMIPSGWSNSSEFEKLHAHAAWSGAIDEKYNNQVLELGKRIKQLKSIPDDSLPKSADDVVIQKLFEGLTFE